jgi:hypothetical protein
MLNPAQHRVGPRNPFLYRSAPLLVCLTSCAVAFSMAGCLFRRRPAIPWATAVAVRPVVQPRAAIGDGADLEAPEFSLDLEPLAALMVPVRVAPPPRPHVPPAPTPTPAAPVAEEHKPPAPIIAPQLSQAEFAAAKQETSESLDIAEKNLAATRGKKLNAAQSDLVSKIEGFLKDARAAARVGDWVLARNLAKKAQVLSEELLHSV